jgi:hypothetical protein
MDCIDKGIEVEFAQKKCEKLIPLMRDKSKATNMWMYILAILASIAVAAIGIIAGIMSN